MSIYLLFIRADEKVQDCRLYACVRGFGSGVGLLYTPLSMMKWQNALEVYGLSKKLIEVSS